MLIETVLLVSMSLSMYVQTFPSTLIKLTWAIARNGTPSHHIIIATGSWINMCCILVTDPSPTPQASIGADWANFGTFATLLK